MLSTFVPLASPHLHQKRVYRPIQNLLYSDMKLGAKPGFEAFVIFPKFPKDNS